MAGRGAFDLFGDFGEEGVGGHGIFGVRVGVRIGGGRMGKRRSVEGGDRGVRDTPCGVCRDAELIREGIDAGVEVRDGIGMDGVVAHAGNGWRGGAGEISTRDGPC